MGRPLEAHRRCRVSTSLGFLPGVDPLKNGQSAFDGELLPTRLTFERLVTCVEQHVIREVVRPAECRQANRARVRYLMRVTLSVGIKVTSLAEYLLARIGVEWSLTGMSPQVHSVVAFPLNFLSHSVHGGRPCCNQLQTTRSSL